MYTKQIILVLGIILILILLIFKKENFNADENKWWNSLKLFENKIGEKKFGNRQDIVNSVNLKCKENEYEERADVDMKNSCEYTKPEDTTAEPILNFQGLTDIIKKPIENKVKEEPSPNEKKKGSKVKEFTNGYKNSFPDIKSFYRYQLCKKYDKNNKEKTIPPEINDNYVRNHDAIKMYLNGGNKKFYDTDNTLKAEEKKKKFHDLFGEPHDNQGITYYLVSRGFKTDKAYINNLQCQELDVLHNKITPKICKECPISTIQTYDFEPQSKHLTEKQKTARKGTYFVEKGGTKKNSRNNKCDLCSYQDGCFSPDNNRMDKYQIQSCAGGNDRKCATCKICKKGFERVKTFCGEGGGTSNTVCEDCTKCGKDEYKIGGCSVENTIEDTVCAKKRDCLGVPGKSDTYQDPGPGKRTYMIDEGNSGSKEEKIINLLGKEEDLKNPFYGKDRTCKICDDCPPGFEVLEGTCSGKNNTKNTVCQRKININSVISKDVKVPEGYFYNEEKIREFIAKKNQELKQEDDGIREKLNTLDINNPEFFNELPRITMNELIEAGKQKCKTCPENTYQDPNDPGCSGKNDTKCIPHTLAKTDGTERILIKGTSTSDNVIGPCQCPEGTIGSNPICDGTAEVKNCIKNISCSEKKTDVPSASPIIGSKGKADEKLYTYDKPSAYGDSTRPDRCKVCDEECPAGKFKIGGCDPNKSTNLVCKDHHVCHPETQIVVEPGTSSSDTVCKCIDGYEWSKDEYGLDNKKKPCIKIKGLCHTNPCHPEAICYDNFDKDGEFLDFVCQCDLSNNYIETEEQGKGPKGCIKISDKHYHPVTHIDTDRLSAPQISDYSELLESKPKALSTLAHTRGLAGTDINGHFHSSLMAPHIHK